LSISNFRIRDNNVERLMLIVLNFHLTSFDLPFKVIRQFFDGRGDHMAWSPVRTKIHENKLRTLKHFLLEVCVGQHDEFGVFLISLPLSENIVSRCSAGSHLTFFIASLAERFKAHISWFNFDAFHFLCSTINSN